LCSDREAIGEGKETRLVSMDRQGTESGRRKKETRKGEWRRNTSREDGDNNNNNTVFI